jgi:hypothetical protein
MPRVGKRGPVLRRATLYDVADIDLTPGDPEALLDHRGQQLPCTPHEGESASVLFCAGAFPDEHQVGVRVAVAEYDLGAGFGQLAATAIAEGFANGLEGRCFAPGRRLAE